MGTVHMVPLLYIGFDFTEVHKAPENVYGDRLPMIKDFLDKYVADCNSNILFVRFTFYIRHYILFCHYPALLYFTPFEKFPVYCRFSSIVQIYMLHDTVNVRQFKIVDTIFQKILNNSVPEHSEQLCFCSFRIILHLQFQIISASEHL